MKNRVLRLLVLCSYFSFSFPFLAQALPDLKSRVAPNPEPALPSNFDAYTPPVNGSQPAAAAPVSAECSRIAGPGDAVALSGDRLSGYMVYGQTTYANSMQKTPAAQYQDSLKAQVLLNAELPSPAMYLLWPMASGQAGSPIAINQTERWWVGPDVAAPGSQASAFGRNLDIGGVAPVVYIKPCNGAGQYAQVLASTPDKIDFTVPSFGNGTYEVWVHNGHGGHWGWSGPQMPTIQPAQNYNGTYNVKNYGAQGNGGSDDTAAIQAAMNAAAGAQGSVYFPAGSYLISQALTPPSHIQLRGDGKEISFIKCASGFGGLSMIFQDQPGQSSYLEIRDMTIDSAGNYNNTSINTLLRLRNQS